MEIHPKVLKLYQQHYRTANGPPIMTVLDRQFLIDISKILYEFEKDTCALEKIIRSHIDGRSD